MALQYLDAVGIRRDSRFGPVLHSPEPVTTVYSHPWEKVVFWPERDYNIAFALYEAMWMIAGRNDLEPLLRYVKTFGQFSDDGRTLRGAYGKRWRSHFERGTKLGADGRVENPAPFDQIEDIIVRLRLNPDDRRCVLQMWDPQVDLGSYSKDVPCNDTVTFQRGAGGELNMVVFCRSNDILWGAYYANAFHFGFLLEYMAHRIGCPVGTYTQVSVNWHGYLSTLETVKTLPRPAVSGALGNPYSNGGTRVAHLSGDVDRLVSMLLTAADSEDWSGVTTTPEEGWASAAALVLHAHEMYRNGEGLKKFDEPLDSLVHMTNYDWVMAMMAWLRRRRERYFARRIGR